jgi:hypothetical protein
MPIFYESGSSPWFDYVANGSIYLLIAVGIAFLGWLLFDIVHGKKDTYSLIIIEGEPVSERASMPITGHRDTNKGSTKTGKSPFAPKKTKTGDKTPAKHGV